MEHPPRGLYYGYILLLAVLPWSADTGFGAWHLSLPSEPLLGALALGLCWQLGRNPQRWRGIFNNKPFLMLSLAYLAWMAVCAGFSTLPVVSWKYWLVEMAHWWVFALGFSMFPQLWRPALRGFVFSLAGVAVYTLAHHACYDFRADQAILAPMPFFPDHTMWAAVVAMVVFLLPTVQVQPAVRTFLWLLFGIALVLSTCRAAGASVLLASFVLGLGRRNWMFAGLMLAAMLAAFAMRRPLGQDVSALERLNRWHCAWRMAADKPVVGFGPGTFQFQYIRFQKPEEMTRISLQEPTYERGPFNYGRGGGAHSEYLRALAELGWPGLLLWAGLLAMSIWKGVSILRLRNKHLQMPLLAVFLALLTFFAHTAVNDFLHDGRLAALVWGALLQMQEEV